MDLSTSECWEWRGGSDSRVSHLVYIFYMILGSSGPSGLG